MTVALFAMHGSIYLYLKTEGELQKRIQGWMWHTFGLFMVLYLLVTILTLVRVPAGGAASRNEPWAVACRFNYPRASEHRRVVIYLRPPLVRRSCSSCARHHGHGLLFGHGLPEPGSRRSLDPAFSLQIYNSSSSLETLKIMLLIAFLGMPFVLAYTCVIYWVFRGKVKLDSMSY